MGYQPFDFINICNLVSLIIKVAESEVRSFRLCDFYDKGHQITDVDKIKRLIGQPPCHTFTIRGLIHHAKCKTDAHFSRTESLKINKTPPLHSLDTVCKLFENATKDWKCHNVQS